MGVYPLRKALSLAEELGLDLVEISPKASPPVCKILEYKKFLYEQKKREKALKAKTSKIVIKEIRFGPNTDEHDYEFENEHANESESNFASRGLAVPKTVNPKRGCKKT